MSSHAQPKTVAETESRTELELLHEALIHEHSPQDSTEIFLVDRMVSALWFANRAAALLQQTEHLSEKKRASAIRILTAYRISNEQSFDRAIQTLQQLRADRDDDAVLSSL